MVPINRWLLLAVCFCSCAVMGQVTNDTLVEYTSAWRYTITNGLPTPDWRIPDFDDNQWNEGPGVFAFPSDEPVDCLGTAIGTLLPGVEWPYCFRRTVILTNNPSEQGWHCWVSADDRAQIYVNGTPAGSVTNSDVCLLGERPRLLQIPGSVFRTGTNVLAAELHQTQFSSDAVFALRLHSVAYRSVRIVSQPTNTTVIAGQRVTFSVQVDGDQPSLQWYQNGAPIPGGTNRTYTFVNANTNQDGITFHFVVRNPVGEARSSNAVLRVLPDTFAPRVLSAVLQAQTNQSTNSLILLALDEPVSIIAATNLTNYVVVDLGDGSAIPLTGKILISGLLIRLTTASALQWGRDYMLMVMNLVDAKGNRIPDSARIGVSQLMEVPVFGMEMPWRYANPLRFRNHDLNPCVALEGSWLESSFDDSGWESGQGILYYLPDSLPNLCAGQLATPITHFVDLGTALFRTSFVLPASEHPRQLKLRHLVDSGAVFYLNGQELYRYNLPEGAITCGTAPVASTVATCITTPALPTATAVAGTNVLAVQVHMHAAGNPTGQGLVFGTEVIVIETRTPKLPTL